MHDEDMQQPGLDGIEFWQCLNHLSGDLMKPATVSGKGDLSLMPAHLNSFAEAGLCMLSCFKGDYTHLVVEAAIC